MVFRPADHGDVLSHDGFGGSGEEGLQREVFGGSAANLHLDDLDAGGCFEPVVLPGGFLKIGDDDQLPLAFHELEL